MSKISFDAVTNLVNALSDEELSVLVNNIKQTKRFASDLVSALSDEELSALIDNLPRTKKFASSLVFDKVSGLYFTPIADKDVPLHFQDTLAKWRKFALDLSYGGLICWKVHKGFTIEHAPKTGPCFHDFDHIKGWNFRKDEPTRAGYVFFIPRLVEDSQSKNVAQQMRLLAMTRCYYDLPDHHLSSFGSAALLCGLILMHWKSANECVPLKSCWARTGTSFGDDLNLSVGGFIGALNLYFCKEGEGLKDHGVFPLGIEFDPE